MAFYRFSSRFYSFSFIFYFLVFIFRILFNVFFFVFFYPFFIVIRISVFNERVSKRVKEPASFEVIHSFLLLPIHMEPSVLQEGGGG